MTSRFARYVVTLLAPLVAPISMAATVTIAPSTLTPLVGETFTVTVTGDVGNTFAATMGLSFDATKVAYVSGMATGDWNIFVKNSPNTANPTVFDIETPTATAASPGTYASAILTFEALAVGAANIVINDDGGNVTGWFDDSIDANYIPVDYTQANVVIAAAPAPVLSVTDSAPPADDRQVPFGQVTEGLTSAPQTITVTNTGDAELVIDLVTALGLPFALATENCSGATLEPAEFCTLTVDFTPASSGNFTDNLDIASNVPTVTVSVSGTGTPIPVGNAAVTDSVAPFTDTQIPFGTVTQNLSATETVTVTNNGNANLAVGQVAMANPLAAPFSIGADTCSNQVLAPTTACNFQVLFEPTATGVFDDVLDIPSDDPDLPTVAVIVSGTGAPVPVGDIAVTDSASPTSDLQADYGNVNLASTVNETFTVANTGTGNLVIGTVGASNGLAAPFSVVSNTCSGLTLAPAATCTIVVAFAPSAEQPYDDSFDLPSDDPDEAAVTLAVSGTGVPAPSGGGGSTVDPAMVLVLGLMGAVVRRRAIARSH